MNLLRNSYVTIFYLFWCCTNDLVVYLSGYVHSASIICCMQYVTTSLNAHFTITRVINIVQSHRLVHISIAHDAVTFNMLFMCVSTRAPSVCVVPDFLKSHLRFYVVSITHARSPRNTKTNQFSITIQQLSHLR